MDETLILMPNVLLLGDLNTRKIYMNKCHMLKKVKKCKWKTSTFVRKKLWQLRSSFLLLSYESTIYARQFIWYYKKWTMDLKISRTQTPKSQILPKAAITKKHQTTVLPWTVLYPSDMDNIQKHQEETNSN